MGAALLYPLAVAVAITVASSTAHRRLPPPVAARYVTASLVLIGVAALPTLGLVALGFLAHLPLLGFGLRWCAQAFGLHGAVPAWVGVPAIVLLAHGSWRARGLLGEHHQLRADLPGPVEVSTDERPFAITRPGRGGRIIISQGLVDLLDERETDVVLAHERAHARHRHDRYLLVAELAGAILPPLRWLTRRVRYSLERWADESAVRACGDRRLVADTLGKVALFGHTPVVAAGFTGLGVIGRVEALIGPAPTPTHRTLTAALWMSLLIATGFAAFQLHHLERLAAALCPH